MIEDVRNFFGDILSGRIKDERIALSKEQSDDLRLKLDNLTAELNRLRSENELLTTDNRDLVIRIRDLDEELKSIKEFSKQGDFVENMGTLWRKSKEGGFERFPYCKRCSDHPVMTPFGDMFICDAGHTISDFSRPPKAEHAEGEPAPYSR